MWDNWIHLPIYKYFFFFVVLCCISRHFIFHIHNKYYCISYLTNPTQLSGTGKFTQEQKRFLSIWTGRLRGGDRPFVISHTRPLCIFLPCRTKRVYTWSSGVQCPIGTLCSCKPELLMQYSPLRLQVELPYSDFALTLDGCECGYATIRLWHISSLNRF